MTAGQFREIGARLKSAFRLSTRPLAVYGSETLPRGISPLAGVNCCFAVALFRMAAGKEVSAIYLGADATEGCCPGGLYHVWDIFRYPMISGISYRPAGKTFVAGRQNT